MRTADLAYARRKVASVVRLAPGSVLHATVEVVLHGDPARELPASVKVELDVDGRRFRAHASATTVTEAVDQVEGRLRRRLERAAHRPSSLRSRNRVGAESWHHGDDVMERPEFSPRPAGDREIVRRKTFAYGELTPLEAAIELERLDHDFYLFTNRLNGHDNVLRRVGEGRYELFGPSTLGPMDGLEGGIEAGAMRPSVLTFEVAVEQLDLTKQPFVFFIDAASRRGHVAYRRYDGHYGLITPDAEPS